VRREYAIEAFATGAWLGLTQVALGFALMAGAGASALIFFGLTAAWLGGGCLGLLVARGRVTALLWGALVLAVVARFWLAASPFSATSTLVALLAGAAAGAYSGAFLRHRAMEWQEVRQLLLHENNGFIAGYVLAAALLLMDTGKLEFTVLVVGLGLAAWQQPALRRAVSMQRRSP